LFGKDLAKDPKILQAATTFPMDINAAGIKLRKMTDPVKVPAVELGLMPEAAKVRKGIKYTNKAISPVLEAGEQASKNDPTFKKPNDFIQWLHDYATGQNSKESAFPFGTVTLGAMSAAVHTTSMNLVNVIHHIAWFPEHIDTLREEIDRVWAESNGNINSSNVAQLDKLDSYIMEASRHGTFKRGKNASPSASHH
jgi:hypothetical protein